MSNHEFKENYDIDNCLPIATFNLNNPENQYDASHWSNCQPLLKIQNVVKELNLIYILKYFRNLR